MDSNDNDRTPGSQKGRVQMFNYVSKIFFASMIGFTGAAQASNTYGNGWALNYDWLDQVVNKTPAPENTCPVLKVDHYKSGFKVALESSFYGSISKSISHWFPNEEIWAAISIGPMKNSFGVIFADISSLSELSQQKSKKLPLTAKELAKWKPTDSAYWESQGGVAFYAGAGYDIVHVGSFSVASGGWANYLEKTGPSTVYVERAKKNIKSVSVSAGISLVSLAAERVVESAKGFNYEFNLESAENAEAFERFMAGDTTLAYELSKIEGSGIRKIGDTLQSKLGKSIGLSLSTPFLPVISLKSTSQKDYSHEEELSIWDERVVKDYGFYSQQNNSRLLGKHQKQATSFKGGITTIESGPESDRQKNDKFYGQFKFAYQSDWGQEGKLRWIVEQAKDMTGLVSEPETCVQVPNLQNTLNYNQLIVQMNLSDAFMRQIFGFNFARTAFLDRIEANALRIEDQLRSQNGCEIHSDGQNSRTDAVCKAPSVRSVFKNIRGYAVEVRESVSKDKNAFAFAMANFGKAVWSNPAVFKAFFDKGADCGMDFSFEVSGQRLTRFYKTKKTVYSDTCVRN